MSKRGHRSSFALAKASLLAAALAVLLSLPALSYAQTASDVAQCDLPASIWTNSYNPFVGYSPEYVFPYWGVDVAAYSNNDVVSLGQHRFKYGTISKPLTFNVIKYDANGKQLCLADYTEYTRQDDEITPKGIVASPDGGFRVIAEYSYTYTGSEYRAVDYNSACKIIYQKSTKLCTNPDPDEGCGGSPSNFISDAADNGAAVGYTQYKYQGYSTWDIISPSGSLIKSYGSTACSGTGNAIAVDKSGNIITAGSTCEGSFIIKLSPSGTEIWKKSGSASRLAVDSQGNIITATGSTIKKLDPTADSAIWSKEISGISVKNLAVDSADNILIAGFSSYPVIVKLDKDGNEKWRKAYTSCVPSSGQIADAGRWGITADSDNNVIATGGTYRSGVKIMSTGANLLHTTIKHNSTLPPPTPAEIACTGTSEDKSKVCCEAKGLKWLKSGENPVQNSNADPQFRDSRGERKAPDSVKLLADQESCGSAPWVARSRECKGSACAASPGDAALCDKASDCVYNGKCYSDIKIVAATFFGNDQKAVWGSPAWKPEVAADINGDGRLEVCDPGQWQNPTGTVVGTVTDSTTSAPIIGATVNMVGTPPNQGTTFTATTAADGTYTVNNVDAFTYDMTASKSGYSDAVKANEPVQPFQTNVADFQLAATGGGVWGGGVTALSGTVSNITGQPVSGAVVKVLGTSFTATTAADGTYSIEGVPTGTYDVSASKPSDGYSDATALGVNLALGTVTIDFTLLLSLGSCTNDCTKVGSSSCDASCDGKGACKFYSEETKQACDGTFGIIDLPGGRQVNCCKGQPYTPQKADVIVQAKQVVKSIKPVLYQGKLVNLVTLLFIPDKKT